MKLSTRLLLPLLATVAVVMLLYGSWALRQRESSLVADAARETQAYATALALAVERGVESPELGGVQEIIDRVSREPKVYGVLVYGTDAAPRFRSDPVAGALPVPPEVLHRVLSVGETLAFERTLQGIPVYSVVRPLRGSRDEVIGALEVAQPLTFLEADKARVRQRYFLNTLTLVVALVVLVMWMVRRFVSEPLEAFSAAVRRLGRGELAHRLDPAAAGGELSEVAEELNRMAEHLERTQRDLVAQAEERVALERRLRQSERLAAMGELAAGVAHEIAAPLHVIRGRADLMLRQEHEQAADARHLRIIAQQIDRITLIVKNLMNFARRREPRPRTVELSELLAGVAEFLEAELEREGVQLEIEGEAPLWVEADPDLLHQVFLNLMLNALHALGARGPAAGPSRIEVRTRAVLDPASASPLAVVEVRDNGPGIPPELRERVFDPFFTTKGGNQGTGLGLSVARAIVEDHGGRIEVADAEPSGAVFRISLALVPLGAGQPEALRA